MSSLESCIRKAGPILNKDDAAAIRAIRDDKLKTTHGSQREFVNEAAVDEYIEILQGEKDFIMRQVEALGGVMADPSLSPSEFSKKSAENLDKAAKVFPQKGIYRPPAETVPIDYKSGLQLTEGFYERNKQLPDFTREILTERSAKTVEMLYPDFYSLPVDQVLAIVRTFDEKAATGLAGQTENQEFHAWAGAVVADWITKHETIPLRYKVEDQFNAKMVDVDPEHPMSVVTKLESVLREAEDAKPKSVRSIITAMAKAGEVKKAAVLASLPQTKLPDVMSHSRQIIKNYTSIIKSMEAWMNKLVDGHAELSKRWMDFNRKNKDGAKGARMLSEFMSASTLSGVDVPTFQMPDAATLKKMNQEKRAMWAKRKRVHAKLLPFWEKLGKMGEETVYEQKRYDPVTDTFKTSGIPMAVSEAQRIYLDVRDVYRSQNQTLLYNLEERIRNSHADAKAKTELIATVRRKFEAGNINPYFAMKRFGKYAAVAKTKSGEIVSYDKFETRPERKDWMDAMRKEGYALTPFEDQATDIRQMQRIDPGFVATVTELLSETVITDEEGNVRSGSSLSDEIWQMYLMTLPDTSIQKTSIHRKGRLGFSHDALRGFADATFHGTHQAAKLKFGHQMSITLEDVVLKTDELTKRFETIKNWQDGTRPEGKEDLTLHQLMSERISEGESESGYAALYAKYKRAAGVSGPEVHEPSSQKAIDKLLREAEIDGPWAVPLANELARRHEYNMNPKSSPWATKMTALGFIWFLSTSPAAGFLNLTQTAISAYPALRARFMGAGAGKELLRASGQYATSPTVEGFLASGKLTEKEKEAMTVFKESGMFSKTRTAELKGIGEYGTDYSDFQEKILNFTGYIFHKTEEMNRVVTSLAAYRLAIAEGRSHVEAITEADELVEISHYDYTNTNRPRLMQGDMGRVIFLFRNYSLNMTYRLVKDFRDMVWLSKNIPIEQRREARSRFLGILGMTSLVAGMSGLPMIWAVEAIANNLLGDDDDPFDSKTEMRRLVFDATERHIGEGWGQTIASAVMKGPWSSFSGMDMSTRASLNNLWIRDIPERLKGDPQGLMLHLAGEGLGPLWGIGMNFATGFSDLQNNRPDRAIERFVPKAVSDVLKTLRYATQGAQTYQRDMILSPEQFTKPSLFVQAMGFSPTGLTDRYDQNRAVQDMRSKLVNRRQDITNRLFMAWKMGDRQVAREVMKDIIAWNKANPRYGITPQGIMQSAKSRAEYDSRTVAGAAVEKRLQYLHNEMQFTNRPK